MKLLSMTDQTATHSNSFKTLHGATIVLTHAAAAVEPRGQLCVSATGQRWSASFQTVTLPRDHQG
jgi:hypothetical protein